MSASSRIATLLLPLLLGACAAPGVRLAEPDALADCRQLYGAVDRAVDRAGVRDVQTAALRGYPYLRADRLLASFAGEIDALAAFDAWVGQLRALDRQARAVELANLPAADHAALTGEHAAGQGLEAALETCAGRLQAAEAGTPQAAAALREALHVPDEYRTSWRVLGLYPLSGWFVSRFVARLHQRTRETFATPLAELAVQGELLRFVPPEAPAVDRAQAAALVRSAERDALGIPVFDPAALERLFAAHAPVFEVDVLSDDDRIGAPAWTEARFAQVDIGRPTLFRKLSHTRWQGRVLVQLNYIVWFPARPRTGPFDILGGHLDGITVRVTLGPDGEPLLYDSMHNCACYHKFYPAAALRLRPEVEELWEPPLIAQRAPLPGEGERVVLRIAPRTHYIERLYLAQAPLAGSALRLADYEALRSLPRPQGGRASLFGTDGIVAGSKRRERYLLWPMGVAAPGAMRQWGHHPIAFVGRRHFDDAYLLEELFEPGEAVVR